MQLKTNLTSLKAANVINFMRCASTLSVRQQQLVKCQLYRVVQSKNLNNQPKANQMKTWCWECLAKDNDQLH